MKKALWFSRHQPTAEQIVDAKEMGYTLKVSETATKLASASLETDDQVAEVIEFFRTGSDGALCSAVFGVFAAPVQSAIRDVPDCFGDGFWAAWNVQRSADGGKPTFAHKKFVRVG